MTKDERFEAALSELVNAVQALAGRSTELRRSLSIANDEAVEFESATDRVVRAVRRLQPEGRR